MDLFESTSLYCDLSQFDNAGSVSCNTSFRQTNENQNMSLYKTPCTHVENLGTLNECSMSLEENETASHLPLGPPVLSREAPENIGWSGNVEEQGNENRVIQISDNCVFSKDVTPENIKILGETQAAVCDKGYSSNEDVTEEVPEPCERNTNFQENDFAAGETVVKVIDDGVVIAWMDVRQIKSNDGCQFYCSVCNASFRSRTNVVVHLRLHKISKPYYCTWCGESSQTEFEAKVHYRSHTGVQRYTCDGCGRRFSKEKMLERHKSNCNGRNSCTKWSPQSSNEQTSGIRKNSQPDISETLNPEIDAGVSHCSRRQEPLATANELPRHQRTNQHDQRLDSTIALNLEPIGNNEFDSSEINNPAGRILPSANKSVKESASKQGEESKQKNKAQRNFVCSTCGKAFKASKPLREHEVVHTGAREFPCEICGKAFGTRANMKIHLSTHSDKRPFACNVCDATFRQKDSLKVHLRKHNGERPFACTICKMTFDRNFTLKNHLLTHGEERSFVCVVCGKAFTTRGGLNNHEKLHSKDPSEKKERKPPSKPGTGNWICDECGKMYSTRSNLKMHQRSHRDVADTYPCCVCGRAYKQKDSLEVHMRRHRDQRPFNCPTCGRSFFRNWTLKLHILTHTGERPHKCRVSGCDKAFTQTSSLYYHVQSHGKKVEKAKKQSLKDDNPQNANGDSNSTVHIPTNTLASIDLPPNDAVMLNVEPAANDHTSETNPLYVTNPLDPSEMRNPVGNDLAIDRVLSGTTSSLDEGTLSIKIAVEGIHASILNAMVLNDFDTMPANDHVTLADSIGNEASLQTETGTLINHVVQPVSDVNTAVESLCQAGVGPITVWENSVLPFTANTISQHSTAVSSLVQTASSEPPPLRPLSHTIDQSLYVLSSGADSVPLLVAVDDNLYHDIPEKTSGLQSVFVRQLN